MLRVDGHTDVRPIVNSPVFKSELGIVVGARDFGGAVLISLGVPAQRLVAAGFAESPGLQHRHDGGSLQAQPPDRIEADGTVVATTFHLRP